VVHLCYVFFFLCTLNYDLICGALLRSRNLTGARDDDLVIVTKAGDIPRASVVRMLSQCEGYSLPVTLEMPGYLYDFGCMQTTHSNSSIRTRSWRSTKLVRRSMIAQSCDSTGIFHSQECLEMLHTDQHLAMGFWSWSPLTILNAGWHLRYFFNATNLVSALQDNNKMASTPLVVGLDERQETIARCLIFRCIHIDSLPLFTRALVPRPVGPNHLMNLQVDSSAWYPGLLELNSTRVWEWLRKNPNCH
jgi:hypothetical protein